MYGFWNLGIFGIRDSRIWGCRASQNKGFGNGGIWGLRDLRFLEFWDFGTKGFRIQGFGDLCEKGIWDLWI